MNKIYRIIWNKARKCLMVVAENAKSCGVGSGRNSSVVNAVAAVLLSLQGLDAQAQTSYVIDTPTTTPISLDTPGDSLDVYSSGSIITETSPAVIAAGNSSVAFITNAGTISSGTDSIYISAATVSGGIYNSGTISAGGSAVKITSSSVNDAIISIGSIYGDANGIELIASTVNGGITSLGIINGPIGVEYDEYLAAIRINSSQINGAIQNFGLIQLTNQGILLTNSSLTGHIVNAGTIISGTWAGIALNFSSVTGSISNSGLISGYTGINVSDSTITGDVQNTGTIVSSGYHGIYVGDSAINGEILNEGVIRSLRDVGINIESSSVSGGVTNSGIIQAETGINVGGGSTIYGGLTNSGLIQASDIGIRIRGYSEILGGITNANSESIVGSLGQGIVIESGSSINRIRNDGGYISGIQNAGTIFSYTDTGIVLNNESLIRGGIQNTGSIAGILIDDYSLLAGGLTNSGTIAGPSKLGVVVSSGSTLSGGIQNTGSIEGGFGVGIGGAVLTGGITNQGDITGIGFGVFLDGSTLSGGIINSGTLSGRGKVGIGIYDSSFSGGLTNAGVISSYQTSGGGVGIGLTSSGFSGGMMNTGSIIGWNTAIRIDSYSTVSGGIKNTGIINGGNSVGILLTHQSLITAGITNSGSIAGGSAGLVVEYGSTLVGGLQNSGTIEGGVGVYVGNSSQLKGGINNSGLIAGSFDGIVLNDRGTITGGITNSGVIASGSPNSIYVSSDSSLDRIVIAGRNTAIFEGNVEAPNTPVTISAGSSYTLGADFAVSGFHNQGILTVDPSMGSSISGGVGSSTTYVQASSGVVRTNVSSSSSFGSTYVNGTANFYPGTTIDVRLSGAGTGVLDGTLLSGVLVASGGISNGTFNVTDNSVLLDFTANVSAGIGSEEQLNLVAANSVGVCSGAVSANTTGPCLVGFDSPSLQVNSGITITSTTSGIQVLAGYSDSSSGINNQGAVIGTQYGVQMLSASTLAGGITNSGNIVGGNAGIILNSATLLGGIQNNVGASISGSSGRGIVIDAYSSANFITNNAGYISGIHNAGAIGNLFNVGGTISGGIFNAGTIASSSSEGIFSGHSAVITGGVINTGFIESTINGISIYGNSLVQQGIVNSGTINTFYSGPSSSGHAGIAIDVNSLVTGGVINSGLIETNVQGILVSDSTVFGGITNSGTLIAGGFAGIKIQGSSLSGAIINSGSIEGDYGIQIRNSNLNSAIINSGTIISVYGSGISLQSVNMNPGIENSGFISATDAGLKISNAYVSGGFTNSGTITATDIGVNVLNSGGIRGGIRNSGSIGGSIAGLAIDTDGYVYGGITNAGVIQGGFIGIRLNSYARMQDGLTNSGVISGGDTGISISNNSTISGGLTNSGVISGSELSIWVSNDSSIDRIVIAGRNTAQFIGDVYAPYTPVTVSGQSSFTMGSDFVVESFRNDGELSVGSSQRSIGSIGGSSSYSQAAGGIFRTEIDYLPGDDYGSLYIYGDATFDPGSGIDIRITGPGSGVTVGSTISGIVSASFGINNSGTFTLTDNSVLLNFNASIVDNQIDVTATSSGACFGTVSSNTTGPCLVGFDSPSLQVNSGITITSTTSGIQVLAGYSDSSSGINNQGAVIGTQYGVQMLSASTLAGGITNSGNIVGGNAGIILNSATLLGGIQNNVGASISGSSGRGIVIDAHSSVAGIINNGGYIGGIQNAGNIITNQSAIVITNGSISGEDIGFIAGNIQNSGTIVGQQGNGIVLGSAFLAGSIQNTGSIAGNNSGIAIYNSSVTGGINNSGTISNAIGSFINAALSLFQSSLAGGITNSGAIVGAGKIGISAIASRIEGGISNSGMISGAGKVGINLLFSSTLSGGLNNSGSIIGGVEHGVVISRSLIANGITNSGKIGGLVHGLNILANAGIDSGGNDYSNAASLEGGLFNAGTIIGSDAVGLNLVGDYATSGSYSTTASALISGGITNSGLIQGASTGIRLSTHATITGGITNSGVIRGSDYSIYVGPFSSVDRIVISGRNTAVFGGDIYAPNTPVTITGGSTYTLGANYQVSSFNNQGTLILNAPGSSSNYSISGDGAPSSYVQSSSGILRTKVSAIDNFGSLYVDGGITLDSNSTIDVRLSGVGTGVTLGSNLNGVLTAANPIGSNGINVTDNSVLLDFNAIVSGSNLNLTAVSSGACTGIISGDTTGPCLVGFDSPSLKVVSGISISGGSSGVQVLAGYSNDVSAGYGILNQQGTISGLQYGIQMLSGSTLSGGITNSGKIIGGNAGIMLNSATLLGGIRNFDDATITGDVGRGIVIDAYSSVAGIFNSGAHIGGIQNAGNIYSNNHAIYVGNSGVIDGGIINTGTLRGDLGAGIYLWSGVSIGGGIQNSGYIAGNYEGITIFDSTISGGLFNTGTIYSSGGESQGAVTFAFSSLSGGITNTGRIGSDGNGLLFIGSQISDGITNSGVINGAGKVGVALTMSTLAGGISNLGTITGNSDGIYIRASQISGGVSNSGLIQSRYQGIDIQADASIISPTQVIIRNNVINGGIINSGSIIGARDGILVEGYEVTSGSIHAVAVSSVTGGIINSGLIQAVSTGIRIASNAFVSGGITNTGNIDAGETGIRVSRSSYVSGGITNTGTITAGSTAIYIGNSQVVGGITNSGYLSGLESGLYIYQSSISGSILNSGSIFGINDTALRVVSSSVIGSITNSGLISGVNGIRVSDSSISGTIHNSGRVEVVNGQAIIAYDSTISGAIINSGTLGVSDGGWVTAAAIKVLSSSVAGGIRNSGLIQYAPQNSGIIIGDSAIDSGITNTGLITGAGKVGISIDRSLINGGVTNTGAITGGTPVAMRLQGSTINDGIRNSGVINGSSVGLVISGYVFANSVTSNAINSEVYGGVSNSGTIIGSSIAGISLAEVIASSGMISATGSGWVSGAIVNSGLIAGHVGIVAPDNSISQGITNSGLIAGLGGIAISITGSGLPLNILNTTSGTIVGAVNGSANIVNNGLYALQTLSGVAGTIVSGSVVHSSIAGDYTQGSSGSLQIGVNGADGSGTASGNYSTLSVGGNAFLDGLIRVNMSSNTSVLVGGTLTGIISAAGLTLGELGITDNSALISFEYHQLGSLLNLTAFSDNSGCTTVSSAILGPCVVAFDSPSIEITNLGSITGAAVGVEVLAGTISGNINNAGLVEGGTFGISFVPGSSLTGGITNSGTILGGDTGIKISSSQVIGGIINSGSIYGSENGILISSGSEVDGGIFNSGVIKARFGGETDSDLGAINLRNSNVLGGITNTGLIELTNQGIALEYSTVTGGISNSGTIVSGTWAGISLNSSSVSGGIMNTGSIHGWQGISLDYSTVSGGVSNTGTIVAFSNPVIDVENSTIHDGINNSGLINGLGEVGIRLSDAIVNGGVKNSGTINGQTTGIYISSNSHLTGGLTNSGLISGSGNSILVSVNGLLDRIVIEGRDTASFNGQVDARHTPVTISGSASYQMGANFIVDGFSNEGILSVNPSGLSQNYSITGGGGVVPSYYQSADAKYRINVSGTTSGAYGAMGVGGSANFDSGSTIDIRLAGVGTSVSGGTTLTGVLVADGGITLGGALNVTDNSVFLDFSASISGGTSQLNIYASTVSACAGTVSVDTAGPCLVGFDSPSLQINSGVTITSTVAGVQVLAGLSDGASVSGFGINNSGAISGVRYGIELLSGSTLTGGITNSGLISGTTIVAGIGLSYSSLSGGIGNSGSIDGIQLSFSTLSGGIVNTGNLNGIDKIAGVSMNASSIEGGINNAGTISSNFGGIVITDSTLSGGITNSGRIITQEFGIFAFSSNLQGGIRNEGLIDSSQIGLAVFASTVSGGISNAGTIGGAGKVGLSIIDSNISGGITNAGSIFGGSFGISIAMSTIAGGIYNSNTIQSYFTGATSSYPPAALSINNSNIEGGITNTGYIAGSSHGVYIANSTIAGSFINDGQILADLNYGVLIRESVLNGTISNSGLIAGTRGLRISSSTIYGAINNSGSIIANNVRGLRINESRILNGFVNSGLIQSYTDDSVSIFASSIGGGINNSGTIFTQIFNASDSAYASLKISSSYINGGITNSGSIASPNFGMLISDSTIDGGIYNSGTIYAENYNGISIRYSTLDFINNIARINSGSNGIQINSSDILSGIENSGTIIAGNNGLSVLSSNIAGNIINTGSIVGVSKGVLISHSSIVGGVYNTGTILGADAGLMIQNVGLSDVDNGGYIAGAGKVGAAIRFSEVVGQIRNRSGATISGSEFGSQLYSSNIIGGFTNSGLIRGGEGVGVSLTYTSLSGGLSNEIGGTIDGRDVGLVIAGSTIANGITNAGLIQGTSFSGIAIFESSIAGTILNHQGGSISGPLSSGILVGDFSSVDGIINDGAYISGISNTGAISSSSYGISVTQAGLISGGINNSGFIYGGTNAINIVAGSSVSGGLTNTGYISGNNYSIYVSPDSSLDRIVIAGFNAANFEGEVNARNTPVTIVGNASYVLSDNFVVNSFSNEGVLTVNDGAIWTIAGRDSLDNPSYANYYQASGGKYRTVVSGSNPSEYGSLNVYGSAIFGAGSGIDVLISGTGTGLVSGSTISGILFADAGVTNSGTFTVTDNSVYLNFATVLSGGNTQIDLVASTATGVCAGSVTGNVTGPCLVGFDSPSLLINSGSTISSSSTGVQVLGGLSDGASVSGFGISNYGVVSGNNYGIQFLSSAYLTGGITNSGLIQGVNTGIIFNHASLGGDINNTGTIIGGVGVQLISSSLSNSITNSGLIAGIDGVAVSVSGSSSVISIQNESSGTVVGAVNGAAIVNNAGLFALQSISGVGGTIVGGSVVNSSLSGTYIQGSGGTLRIGVNGSAGSGTIAGNYSTLSVDGSASISGIINVNMNADDAVLVGGTLAGILNASSGYQVLGLLAVTDNSALVDFEYTGNATSLDLVAIASISGCGTVTSAISGPCQVAYDAPNIEVTNLGTIAGSAIGIQVLSGVINGRILNAGLVSGSQYAIAFNPEATLTGGITNAGTIIAGSNAIHLQNSRVMGGIANSGSIAAGSRGVHVIQSTVEGGLTNSGSIAAHYGVSFDQSSLAGGLTNTGRISANNAGISFASSDLDGYIRNSGTVSGGYSGISINYSTISGLINQGRISGGTQAAIGIQLEGNITSGISNSGTITGYSGIDVTGANVDGGIRSAGEISGTIAGISVNAYASVLSYGPSTYLASSINTSISGGIINDGTITATSGSGVLIKGAYSSSGGVTAVGYSVVTGGVINSGKIIGQNSIALSRSTISGGITNSGSLVGSQVAISVTNAGLVNGSITNSGLISGSVSGVTLNASTISGAINNSGLIAGGGNAAIAVAASAISGGINNSGVISGFAGPAIQISGSSPAVEIQNTGTIIGAINGAANVNNAGLFALQSVSGLGGTIVGGSLTHSTIAGNFTQGSSGILQIGVNGNAGSGTLSGNYSTLTVGGSANVSGKVNVNMSAADAVTIGGTLAGVVSSGSGLTVSGLSITDNSALIGFEYGTTSGALNLVAVQEVSFSNAVEQNNNPAAVPASNVLQSLSTNTPAAMQGVINKLYSLPTTLAVSNAISQTLPAMVGAASQASAQSQQNFNQIMQGRQNQLRGLSSGEEYIGSKEVWFKGFGSWANQDAINNVSGYKVNTGGLAVGIDKELSLRSNIGAVFAFGNSGMSSTNSAAAGGVTVNSYQLGVYGDTYLRPDIQLNYQIDGAFNNNKAYRNLSAFNGVPGVATSSKGVNANGSYNSTSAHVGGGVKKFLYLSEDTSFIPSLRADFTSVQSKGYTETGAGALNMTVNSQTYNMLVTSADLRLDHQFTDKFRASVNVGAGYNILNNQVQVTSAYQGGGAAFTTKGLQVSPWQYSAGIGLSGKIQKDVEVNVRYDTQFTTTGYSNQMVSGKVKFLF